MNNESMRLEMENCVRLVIGSYSDIIMAREHGRRIGKDIGFPVTDLTRIATGISEIARNIVIYAESGEMFIQVVESDERHGIEIKAHDNGPGISDITLAMSDGYSTGNRRGLGLPGTRRLMDEFKLESANGRGTTVIMRKWLLKSHVI